MSASPASASRSSPASRWSDPTAATAPRRHRSVRCRPCFVRRLAFPCPAKHATMVDRKSETRMRSSSKAAAAVAVIAGLAIAPLVAPRLVTDVGAQGVNRPPGRAVETNVDVELVIAVDVSYSMDPDEQALQREGYITGLTSPEFLNALHQGAHGKIAITYFEWAGSTDQRIVVPWRLIDGPAAARAFADEVARAPYRRAYRTSISGALRFAQ